MKKESGKTYIYTSGKKGLWVPLVCLVFCIIGYYALLDKAWFVAITTLLFFGGGGIFFLFYICIPRKAVILSQEGIIDKSTLIHVGLIRWDDIEKITPTFGGSFISVCVKNPSQYINKAGFILNWFLRKNQELTIQNSITHINIGFLEISWPDLELEIKKYYPNIM